MMVTKELLIQWRDALDHFDDVEKTDAALASLQAAIDAPEPEPVAWRYVSSNGVYRYCRHNPKRDMANDYAILEPIPLYTHPPAVREPLSDAEWFAFWGNCDLVDGESVFPEFLHLARAIEAAVSNR